MSFDMDQFKQVYIEESIENVETMEKELLSLDEKNVDLETINTIFRAAHSIKGGAATFGFMDIAHFTHDVETLLDELRAAKRDITVEIINCLLSCTDCIKMMLDAHVIGQEKDESQIEQVLKQVKDILNNQQASPAEAPSVEKDEALQEPLIPSGKVSTWSIDFIPHEDLLFTGNEPLRLFRELEQLGQLDVQSVTERVPDIDDIDPEKCYLSWILKLTTEASEADIREVFSWVEDDCDLHIVRDDGVTSNDAEQVETNAPMAQNVPGEQVGVDSQLTLAVKKGAGTKTETEKTTGAATAQKPSTGSVSIRVDIEKVDTLINLVGELVITQSMLSELGNDFNMGKIERLQSGLGQLLQNTKELQESVMRIRMLPISNAFNRFPRMVRDLAQKLGKKINLEVSGEQTELDKTVMEQITDPLVHLVRNSMDHGIEMPDVRSEKGKSESGTIKLHAYHEGGSIVIEIIDDGAGIDKQLVLNKAIQNGLIRDDDELPDSEIYNLIFTPGFSTAKVISDVSGRGVGMDVVKRNIASLGGEIEIESEYGFGTTIRVRLPLTLSIVDGQLIKVADQTYVVPLISIVESLQIREELVRNVSGAIELYKLRDENVPIVRIYEEFSLNHNVSSLANSMLVVVEGAGTKIGLLVDELLAQQQVVIKSLETNYCKVEGVSGATILGDGQVALIIDVADLIRKTNRQKYKNNQGKAA